MQGDLQNTPLNSITPQQIVPQTGLETGTNNLNNTNNMNDNLNSNTTEPIGGTNNSSDNTFSTESNQNTTQNEP